MGVGVAWCQDSCLKSLAWHGLASRDAVKSRSARTALLGWGEWAGCVGTWRRWGHVVGAGGWRAVLRGRATGLDRHFGKTGARDDTLLAAIHLGAEGLEDMLVEGLSEYAIEINLPSHHRTREACEPAGRR